MTVDFCHDGIDYEVEGDYSPGTPDVHYLANGDPGYPGDPPEFEIEKVEADGKPLTDDEIQALCDDDKWLDKAYEKAGEAYADSIEDAAESRAEAARERALGI